MSQVAGLHDRRLVRGVIGSALHPIGISVLFASASTGVLLAQRGMPSADAVTWIGSLSIAQRHQFVELSFNSDQNQPFGSADVPGECWFGLPITDRRVEGGALTLVIEKLGHIHGVVSGDTFAGTAGEGEAAGPFHLVRAARVHPSVLERLYGDYQLPDASWISISPLGDPAVGLAMRTGDSVQFLNPVVDTAFIAAPSGASVVFSRTPGEPWRLRVKTIGSEVRGTRVTLYRTEDVAFQSDGVVISGTLMLPSGGTARRPAVLFVHGSGPAGRNQLWLRAEDLASHGIVTLITDKRGSGRSGGDWRALSFQDRVDDALSAVDYLRHRSEVDAAHIGLWGISQGGWVLPMAAAQSREVAFIIPVSAPGVNPADQELYRLEWQLRSEGHTESDITTILDGWRLAFAFMHTRQGSPALDSAVRNIWKRFGRDADDLPPPSTDIGVDDVMINLGLEHDPVPPLRNVHIPVLAIWGANDKLLPVERSVTVFRDNLAQAGDSDVTLKVFPGATHALEIGENGASRACQKAVVLAPGYFTTIRDWIRRVTS